MPIFLQVAHITVGEEFVAIVVAFQDISALKETDRAKNQFLMVLSHEMKTPLTSIIGWAQLAQTAPDIVPEALSTILRNAEAQRALIERLLMLSYILTGKFILHLDPMDFRPLVEAVVAETRAAARERGIMIALHAPATCPRIGADEKYLRQALREVLDNALRFTDAGGQVTVSLRLEDNSVRLRVRDTGYGIAPEQIPLLLDPFQQIQRDETKGGLGIGLALARGIVDAHGGRLSIVSGGLGQGTTVCLEFPLLPGHLP